ncbi:unnamed protein product [Musa textilis]
MDHRAAALCGRIPLVGHLHHVLCPWKAEKEAEKISVQEEEEPPAHSRRWGGGRDQRKGAGSDREEEIDFRGGNVHVITSKESWDQKILEANKDGKIVVANFSASWCGPCRVIAPLYKELSQKYPSLMFLTIDVDELMEFSSSWDIRATPTFLFLKDGQQLDKLVGANRPELEKMIIMFADSSFQGSKGSN